MKKNIVELGVSYYGTRFIEHAKRDLADIAECCTYCVLPFSETDMYFHKGAYEKIVREAHKRGLSVWADPWALAGVFGGETFSKFLIDHRRAWQFISNGRSVPCACFNNPEFRSYMKLWIKTVHELGADVILWDEPHYHINIDDELDGIYACTCWVCREKFKRAYRCEMPQNLDARAREFRLASLERFLHEMMGYSKKLKMRNALTIYAIKGIAEYDMIWEKASSIDQVDIFGCDPYWRWHFKSDVEKHVGYFSKKVVESCRVHNKEAHIWVQAMKMPAGKEYEIAQAIKAAYDSGIRNIAAWSYDGGELTDGLFSPNYRLVWETVKKAFINLR